MFMSSLLNEKDESTIDMFPVKDDEFDPEDTS